MSFRPATPSAPGGPSPRSAAVLYFLSRAGVVAAVAGYGWFYRDSLQEHWPVAAGLAGALILIFMASSRSAARHRCPVCREGVLRVTGKLHPHAKKWLGLSSVAPAAWDMLTRDNHQCMHCHSRCRNQRSQGPAGRPAPGFSVAPWNPLTGGSVFDPAPPAPQAAFIAPGALFAEVPPTSPAAVPPPFPAQGFVTPGQVHAEERPSRSPAVTGEWEMLPAAPSRTEPVWTKEAFWEAPPAATPIAAPAPVSTEPPLTQAPNPFLSQTRETAPSISAAPLFSEPPPASPRAESAPPPPEHFASPASLSPPVDAPSVSPSASFPPPSSDSMEINVFPPPPLPSPPVTVAAAMPAASLSPLPGESEPSRIPVASPASAPPTVETAPEMLRDLLDVMRDGRRALDSAFDQILVRLQQVLGEAPAAVAAVGTAPPSLPVPVPAAAAAAAELPPAPPAALAPEWPAPPKPQTFTEAAPPPPATVFPIKFPVLEGKTAPFPAPLQPVVIAAAATPPLPADSSAQPPLPTAASTPAAPWTALPPLLPMQAPAPEPVRPVAAPAAPANWFPVHSIAPAPLPAAASPTLPPAASPPPPSVPLPFPPPIAPGTADWNPASAFFAPPPATPPAPATHRPRRLPALDPLTAQELSHTLANAFTPSPPAAPTPQPVAPPSAESPFQFLGSPLTEEPWPDLPDSPWNHPRSRFPQS